MYTVRINFENANQRSVTLKNVKAGLNLLEVVLANNIALRHDCGGVCACSTCHLYVSKGGKYLEEISRREKDFIIRARNPREGSRLGCQCTMLPGKGIIEVLLPDQTPITL